MLFPCKNHYKDKYIQLPRLRKERIAALSESNTDIAGGRLDLVVKSIVYDESNDQSKNVEDIEISHVNHNNSSHHSLAICIRNKLFFSYLQRKKYGS